MPRPELPVDRSGPGLITRHLIAWVENNLNRNRQVGDLVMAQLTSSGYYPGAIVAARGGEYLVQWVDGTQQWTPPHLIWSDPARTKLACHSLMGGLFALLGAVLASLFAGGLAAAPPIATKKDGHAP
jgi:hypothetical protein